MSRSTLIKFGILVFAIWSSGWIVGINYVLLRPPPSAVWAPSWASVAFGTVFGLVVWPSMLYAITHCPRTSHP